MEYMLLVRKEMDKAINMLEASLMENFMEQTPGIL